jgi:hypothetical protein
VERVLIRRRTDPSLAAVDELAINHALEANGVAPIELRIAAAGAGLELIAWDTLVEDPNEADASRTDPKNAYRDRSAAENLAVVLGRAMIPDGPGPPALRSYSRSDDGAESGATAVVALRNRVMRPHRRSGQLSARGDAWVAGWSLATHQERVHRARRHHDPRAPARRGVPASNPMSPCTPTTLFDPDEERGYGGRAFAQ